MLEDNLVDEDYDYEPDDVRPEREKKRTRLAEALAENNAPRGAAQEMASIRRPTPSSTTCDRARHDACARRPSA